MKMGIRFGIVALIVLIALASCAMNNSAQPANVATTVEAQKQLFAVEIKVGPNWDSTIPPNEQEFFSEHSANLKRLRDAGHIVMGARYSDIGLIVFSASSAESVRALMSQDPSMTAGTFTYKVHRMNVFYPGLVQP